MKARMKNDLVSRYIDFHYPEDYPDEETKTFLRSIEGREVELVFIGDDAFERQDNNIWLPNVLWDALEARGGGDA